MQKKFLMDFADEIQADTTFLNRTYRLSSCLCESLANSIPKIQKVLCDGMLGSKTATIFDEVFTIKIRRGMLVDIYMLCEKKIQEVKGRHEKNNIAIDWLNRTKGELKALMRGKIKDLPLDEYIEIDIDRKLLLSCRMLCEMSNYQATQNDFNCNAEHVKKLYEEVKGYNHLLG